MVLCGQKCMVNFADNESSTNKQNAICKRRFFTNISLYLLFLCLFVCLCAQMSKLSKSKAIELQKEANCGAIQFERETGRNVKFNCLTHLSAE